MISATPKAKFGDQVLSSFLLSLFPNPALLRHIYVECEVDTDFYAIDQGINILCLHDRKRRYNHVDKNRCV